MSLINVKLLVIAAGGGGGNVIPAHVTGVQYTTGGGGGAGGYYYNSSYGLNVGSYTITVGSGGGPDTSGGNSSFNGVINMVGGGNGGDASNFVAPGNGGSGGGGGSSSSIHYSGGSGTAGQGNAGGTSYTYGAGGGGGGGSSSAGTASVGINGTNGGSGTTDPIFGNAVCYGGGGGGSTGGSSGGGGYGGSSGSVGSANGGSAGGYGNGGGGACATINQGNATGGSGSGGIIAISFPIGSLVYSQTNGTVTSSGGNTIVYWTGNGSFKVNGYGATMTDYLMNGASRLASFTSKYLAVMSDRLMNAAGRFAYVASTIAEIISSIAVSTYKWLTSTLITAQQSPAVRPYFTCQIVDDKIVPNSIISPNYGPTNSSSVTAPDGNILTVGTYSSNGYLGFWKVSDGSVLSNWTTPSLILDSSSGYSSNSNLVNSAISVSEYINGTYSIDVAYFITVSGAYQIVHQYSNDGGLTWTVDTPIATGISVGSTAYIDSGKSFQDINGIIQRILFYTDGTNIYYASTKSSWFPISWSSHPNVIGSPNPLNSGADTYDWKIHSLDSYYDPIKDWYYVVYAGYHKFLESTTNYSIYLTVLETRNNGSDGYGRYTYYQTTLIDLWRTPKEILSSLSSSTQNQNSFTLPKVNYDGTYVWLMFNAQTVSEISTATVSAGSTNAVTTTIQYFLTRSSDYINFTYPTIVTFSDGTVLSDASTPYKSYNFIQQGNYYYIVGNGKLWQWVKNNITADVTNDVLGYSIQESAGNPSSVNLVVGNQNGQWVGPTPTSPGYQAIMKDRKIYINQEYYTTLGIPEVTARNIYYIDDIQQNVTNTNNDLTIVGRDLNKLLQVTTSKYNYNLQGPYYYSDVFDGTTISNWNVQSGRWKEVLSNLGTNFSSVNMMATYKTADTNFINPGYVDDSTDYVITLSRVTKTSPSSIMSLMVQLPPYNLTGNSTYIYPFYQDANNWIRFRFSTIGGNNIGVYTDYCVNGVATIPAISGASIPSPTSSVGRTVTIKKYDYYVYDLFVSGEVSGSGESRGNGIEDNDQTLSPNSLEWLNIDMSSVFQAGTWTNGSVGFGCFSSSNSDVGYFGYFKYMEYAESQNIKQLIETIGSLSDIHNFKSEDLFNDKLFSTTPWSGTYSMSNRQMTITPGHYAFKNDDTFITNPNAEITFEAKLNPINPVNDYGFTLIFRSQFNNNLNSSYFWNISKQHQTNYGSGFDMITSRFQISNPAYNSGNPILMMSSSPYDYTNVNSGKNIVGNLNIDLTKWHTYRLIMSDSWMHMFIDDKQVASWNDNNQDINYMEGYIGFQADPKFSNANLTVRNISSNLFFNQIENISINPGDDMSTALNTVSQTIYNWTFSDLMGRLKSLLLQRTDPPNYTYQNEITTQSTDNSDKEYVNQVTVYGTGVSAIAADSASIAQTGKIRDLLVTDYKILTYSDALARAQYELVNASKFNNQSNITETLNVGSELLDVITVINTGPNSSNVDSNLRIFTQQLEVGGGNNSTSNTNTIETGNV